MAAIKKLGEVCVITMGQSPCSESYNDIGKGMPFFQGCSDFGKLNPHITTYCDMPKKTADINDVLIYGVMDGHGVNGHFASKYVKDYITHSSFFQELFYTQNRRLIRAACSQIR